MTAPSAPGRARPQAATGVVHDVRPSLADLAPPTTQWSSPPRPRDRATVAAVRRTPAVRGHSDQKDHSMHTDERPVRPPQAVIPRPRPSDLAPLTDGVEGVLD